MTTMNFQNKIKGLCLLSLVVSFWGLEAQQDYIGAGNDTGLTITSSHNYNGYRADNTVNGSGMDADLMEASRLLSQATMGYNMEEVERTAAMGLEAWVDNQLTLGPNYLRPQMDEIWEQIYGWNIDYYTNQYLENNPGAPITEEILESFEEDIYGPWALNFHYAWWQNTILSSDQLRQKVAYALSQIVVISINSDLVDHGDVLSSYYDIFLKHAFGNYRDIIGEVSLTPAMGLYLSHYNNPKEVPEENLHPDENYAREIMQLFSIGLYELNQDGTRKKDAQGNDIPTYNNNDIKELAKVFTGLGAAGVMENPWVDTPFFGMDWYLADKDAPMKMYQEWHETSEKTILGELVLPAGQQGMRDVEMAIDFLFEHDNVGPFLARQLIQRIVKSNPSPGYVARVAAAFADNGAGERGDLGAVVKAILMDVEARTCAESQDEDNGQLIEPLLRITQLGKAFPLDCRKDSVYTINGEDFDETPCQEIRYWLNGFSTRNRLRQSPLGAPSVFNFYLPDHQPVGEMTSRDLYGPEYKIHDSSTAINYINMVFLSTVWNYYGGSWDNDINEDLGWLSLNTSAIEPYAENPEDLYNYLDILFTRGHLSDRQRESLRDFVNDQPNWVDNWDKTRSLIFLMMISPDYTIRK